MQDDNHKGRAVGRRSCGALPVWSIIAEKEPSVSILTAERTEKEKTAMAEERMNPQEENEDEVKYCERKRVMFFGLPWTFTKYTITPSTLTIDQGFFKIEENDCYMYKIQDVKLTATLMERIFGLGTVICYTGDVTDPELRLVHIKHAKEIKSYLLKASEAARMKRRTLNTLDIGASADLSDLDD